VNDLEHRGPLRCASPIRAINRACASLRAGMPALRFTSMTRFAIANRLSFGSRAFECPTWRFLPRRIAGIRMAIYTSEMDISVTEFRHRCLEIIRRVEKTGKPVTLTRRGKAVARLQAPIASLPDARLKPWEQLRALGGWLLARPGESVISDEEFEALR
jgi:prevent-host-death family protein